MSITGEHFGIVLSHEDRPGVSHGHPVHQRQSLEDARELSTAVTDPISRSHCGPANGRNCYPSPARAFSEIEFATDSPLEGGGFEPRSPVWRRM